MYIHAYSRDAVGFSQSVLMRDSICDFCIYAYVYMYVYMYVYIYICIYVYVYMCVCIYRYIDR